VLAATRAAGLDPETLRAHYYRNEELPGPFAPPVYVRPSARGLGAARALVTRLLEEARAYEEMGLETRTFMPEAIALYASLGFTSCEPFHEIPESFRAATRFLSRRLE
jgi:GNAT superfamily N-acetyltransferase